MRAHPGGAFRDRAPIRCKALILAGLGAVGIGVMIAPGASADPVQISVVHTAPPPAIEFPNNEVASGAGATPVITEIPDGLWNRMPGYSWTPGCPIGRSELKLVRVNF